MTSDSIVWEPAQVLVRLSWEHSCFRLSTFKNTFGEVERKVCVQEAGGEKRSHLLSSSHPQTLMKTVWPIRDRFWGRPSLSHIQISEAEVQVVLCVALLQAVTGVITRGPLRCTELSHPSFNGHFCSLFLVLCLKCLQSPSHCGQRELGTLSSLGLSLCCSQG